MGGWPRAAPEGWAAGCLVSLTLPALGEHLPAFPCVATGGQWSQGCRRQAVLGGGRRSARSAFIPVPKADCVCAAPSPPSSRCVLAGVFGKHAASRGPSESLLIWLATADAPGSCVYFSRAQAGQDTGARAPKLGRVGSWNHSCSSASSKLGDCSILHSSPAPQPSPAPWDAVGGETRGIPNL